MKTNNVLIQVLSLLSFFSITANAQKLPNKQELSVRAPENIQIDGKLTEWGDKLQAFNRATEIFYTLSNDDNYLYLTIRINKPIIINKAISGSITLTVNGSGKKSDEKCPAISFPLLNSQIGSIIRMNLYDKTLAIDSLLIATNKTLVDNAKEIKISDIGAITDTLTGTHTSKKKYFFRYPLYDLPGYYIITNNSSGIRAAASFESKWIYNYELAVPLKYLNLTLGKKFSYNIRLNGAMYKTSRPTAGFTVTRVYNNGVGTTLNEDLLSPTDLWGDYILAGKN
ncbi:MAG: hypothetical protein V4560_03000 [Bacteroidota bacterium]